MYSRGGFKDEVRPFRLSLPMDLGLKSHRMTFPEIQPHLPEVGLEPRSLRKDAGEFAETLLRHVSGCKFVKLPASTGRDLLVVNRRGILTPYRRPIFTPPVDDQRLACPALAGVAEGRPSAGDGYLRL